MSAGIRQSVRHPRMSDSKVVVVDASSWIVEAFFFLIFWRIWRWSGLAIVGM